jgi:hypothetical protein
VPDHKQIRVGTLRRIVADAGMTVDQFIQLLRRRPAWVMAFSARGCRFSCNFLRKAATYEISIT